MVRVPTVAVICVVGAVIDSAGVGGSTSRTTVMFSTRLTAVPSRSVARYRHPPSNVVPAVGRTGATPCTTRVFASQYIVFSLTVIGFPSLSRTTSPAFSPAPAPCLSTVSLSPGRHLSGVRLYSYGGRPPVASGSLISTVSPCGSLYAGNGGSASSCAASLLRPIVKWTSVFSFWMPPTLLLPCNTHRTGACVSVPLITIGDRYPGVAFKPASASAGWHASGP